MIPSCLTIIREVLAQEPRLNAWQWAEANIDYSRAPSYDSEWKGPYRIDYMPYLREPMEACTEDGIKEVWMWACTRGGKSENLLLTIMRYMLACRPPYAMLYMGAQEYKVAQFFDRRIVRGMALSEKTAERIKKAHVGGCLIDFDGLCDFIAGWATNRQIAKGDSYPVILADEVSSWPSFKADTLRERQATVAFPKLIGVSSADAESRRGSDEDPIIQEWENTDRREYMMPDPGDRTQRFRYVMGGAEGPGIHWDQGAKRDDGTWDMEVVENTAYYQTPAGARVEERDRLALSAEGVWTPTAKCVPYKRGYRVTRMMTPFATGGFGNMAR
jgi:phage terminase large subunit GpA-like protein